MNNTKGLFLVIFMAILAGFVVFQQDSKLMLCTKVEALCGKQNNNDEQKQQQNNGQPKSSQQSHRVFWMNQLKEAGFVLPSTPSHKNNNLTASSLDRLLLSLPTQEEIAHLYGPSRQLLGMERCEAFQKAHPPETRYIGIAGLFNTNTNLIYRLLKLNCIIPRSQTKTKKAILWQVPWSKHMLAKNRMNHIAKGQYSALSQINKDSVLPVVMVRDPFFWMQSMCRHSYNARFRKRKRNNNTNKNIENIKPSCPKLLAFPDNNEKNHSRGDGNTVWIDFSTGTERFSSLAHLWQDWNRQYYEADFARLMVRFEDVIFHTKETVTQICTCAGGSMKPIFVHHPRATKASDENENDNNNNEQKERRRRIQQEEQIQQQKKQQQEQQDSHTDWLSAVIKYAREDGRYKGMEEDDLNYAADVFDSNFLEAFHYKGWKKGGKISRTDQND